MSTQSSVFCKKLQKEAQALTLPPVPGALGQRLMKEISQPAWDAWIDHQRMLINEYRLNLCDQTVRDFLKTEMEKFLFGDSSEKPPGFVEPA